jgi:hypothetical protein
MKKFVAIALVLCMALSLAACNGNQGNKKTALTYAEYAAIQVVEGGEQVAVEVEFYVQAAQGWWFDSNAGYGKITVYGQDKDGAYFAYEMKCDEADAAKLTAGTKINVKGYKTVWSGEYEIVDATFTFVKDADTYIAPAKDLTDKLGTEELVNYQNQFASFKGLTVSKIEYQGGEPGKDIYVTVSLNDKEYSFCVESYLTGPDSDVYKAVGALAAGDVIDVEGFVYWYNGVNTHITKVVKK